MDEILVAAGVIAPVILAFSQLLKLTNIDSKWLPWTNVLVGVAGGAIYALTIVKGDYSVYCWGGCLAGLAAGGFYDALQISKKSETEDKEGD